MSLPVQQHTCDVLVVGGGIAAGAAALAACSQGARTLVLDQGRFGRSGSSATAGGGTAAAFGHTHRGVPGNADTPEQHFADTIAKGCGIADPDLVRILVQESPDAVRRLMRLGVPYACTEQGLLYQNHGVGQTHPRNCTPRGNGAEIAERLIKEAAFRGAGLLAQCRVFSLYRRKGAVAGAVALDTSDPREPFLRLINARAVVLAAGSATALLPHASAAFTTSGDGFRLAFEAGASIANMEFLEFTFVPLIHGRAVPCGGSTQLTSRGADFLNASGERFMERLNPGGERVTRAFLVEAFYREMQAGRGPVRLDCTSLSAATWAEWEGIGHPLLTLLRALYGEGYPKASLELVPALHCLLGGVLMDADGRTDVPGLWVAGENATGVQGAVRLGGNAIAECLVFGQRAGRNAAEQARQAPAARLAPGKALRALDAVLAPQAPALGGGERLRRLRQTAWDCLGVVRREEPLRQGVRTLAATLEEANALRAQTPADVHALLDLRGLALTGLLCARAALARRESRGGHLRDDFPKTAPDVVRHVFRRQQPDPVACPVSPQQPRSNG